MKIVVLAGGYSPEREVSLCSGSLIANALMERGHRVLLLDVYEGMRTLPLDPDTLFLQNGHYTHTVTEEVPDLAALKTRTGNGDALIGPNVTALCQSADKVFLALHGSMGENGQLQAYLDSCGIRYTGSGYLGCALAMDKDISKRLFRDSGVPTPDWKIFCAADSVEAFCESVTLPCVVKPCNGGSSVGVSMAETKDELIAALTEASKWEDRILVEQKITGREFTMGILDGTALPPVEIIPYDGFYDYKNKYQGTTKEICPAEIPRSITDEMARLTLLGFRALRLAHYARFDFLLDADGQLWCLEANALPGMTPTSLLPQEAAAVGISYPELCEKILCLGD